MAEEIELEDELEETSKTEKQSEQKTEKNRTEHAILWTTRARTYAQMERNRRKYPPKLERKNEIICYQKGLKVRLMLTLI